ncbi:MAG: D-N-carbamoylase [Frankiales bacterium]|jgi:predicted amidohydrolase|nr:D-N-carbamoylase [Frankiales bacterium]
MSVITLMAAQMGPASELKQENVDRAERLVVAAGRARAALVVLPELALSPYFPIVADEEASRWSDDPATSSDVARIARAAARAGLVCVLPVAERRDGQVFNSALVIDADGSLSGTYQKAHIPGRRDATGQPLSGEVCYFADGESGFRVFPTAVGRVGVLICADRGYPEAWRALGLGGAEIVAAPYNTSVQVPHDTAAPAGPVEELRRIQHLRMAAAALTNGYFVVAAGKGGVERGVQYVADSQVLDPWGRARARSSTDGDELVSVQVDLRGELDRRDAARQLDRRRPELYAALAAQVRR